MTLSGNRYGKLAAITLLVGSTLGLVTYGAGATPLTRAATEAVGRDVAAKTSVELAGYRRHHHHRRHRHYRRRYYGYGYGYPYYSYGYSYPSYSYSYPVSYYSYPAYYGYSYPYYSWGYRGYWLSGKRAMKQKRRAR